MIHLVFRRGRRGDVSPEESSGEQSKEEELPWRRGSGSWS